ncbi:MAG: hypothetical protein ACPGYJ_07845, partial [bacterium]
MMYNGETACIAPLYSSTNETHCDNVCLDFLHSKRAIHTFRDIHKYDHADVHVSELQFFVCDL